MKLIVTSFLTLDGVMEAPGMEEHRDGKNAWALRVQDEEMVAYNKRQIYEADAILLGRKTYQIWAAFWPTATGDDDLVRRLNELPKYVVSNTMRKADWTNSLVLAGDVIAQIRQLREQPGGDLLVYGSADLVHELVRHDLVNEYRLIVYPVILGSGKRLFRDGLDVSYLRLIDAHPYATGAVLLTYQPEAEAPTSPYVEDYSWTQEQVRSLQAAQNVDRVLATVLFTDLVESTSKAASLGDRAWRQLLDRHDESARVEVERWLGRFVRSTGDGVLATFDTPTRALRCAFGLHDAFRSLGLEIRAALHTGEIELRGDDIGGIGVHIASRVLSQAEGGQVIVTRTVRDLATGTDLTFSHLASVPLRGVPGQWDLFEAKLS